MDPDVRRDDGFKAGGKKRVRNKKQPHSRLFL